MYYIDLSLIFTVLIECLLHFAAKIRLAIFLRFAATGSPASILAELFKLGVSTVHKIIEEVGIAIVDSLPPPFFPPTNTLVERFNHLRPNAFPGVIGAVDGSHIRIDTPCHNPADYYCYKKFKSIILLAIAGPDCECLWFNVGFPGKAGDARVFRESGLQDFVCSLNGNKHLIGDGAFPLSLGLMKPYDFEGATEEQELFNFKLSSSRMVIECFFGHLKSRFRCLLKGLPFRSIGACCTMVSACVLLNNYILFNSNDDDYNVFLDDDILEGELDNWINPSPDKDEKSDDDNLLSITDSTSGTAKRDIICKNFGT